MKRMALFLLFVPAFLLAGLISTPDLNNDLKNPKLVILDVRDEKDASGSFVTSGHIPGSRFVAWKNVTVDRDGLKGMVPNAALFEQLAQSLGVNNDSKVVIVTDGKNGGTFGWGTRLYWTFKYYGFENVHMLNGGLLDWTDNGFTLSKEKPAKRLPSGNFKTKGVNQSIYASKEDVMEAVNKKTTIIDARPINLYLGIDQRSYAKQAGHIQGAKNAPFDLYFKEKTALVRSKADLEKLFESLNIDTKGDIIVHCNTAHLASVAWFVMHEVMGKKVRLYDGSMNEWEGPVSTKIEN